MAWESYKIQYLPTRKFISKADCTYALNHDGHEYPEYHYDYKKHWEEAHWFCEEPRAKQFESFTHIRRAFAGLHKKGQKFDDYVVIGVDGSSRTLTSVFDSKKEKS